MNIKVNQFQLRFKGTMFIVTLTLGKLVTQKPVDFVGFDNVVESNKIGRMMITL